MWNVESYIFREFWAYVVMNVSPFLFPVCNQKIKGYDLL